MRRPTAVRDSARIHEEPRRHLRLVYDVRTILREANKIQDSNDDFTVRNQDDLAAATESAIVTAQTFPLANCCGERAWTLVEAEGVELFRALLVSVSC